MLLLESESPSSPESTLETAGARGEFMGREEVETVLRRRLGSARAASRMGLEVGASEFQDCGGSLRILDIRRILSQRNVIETVLRWTGMYGMGARNAAKVALRTNVVASAKIPSAFHGFTLLHLSDLHSDMSGAAMGRMLEVVAGLSYDVCVMTGDYRGATLGSYHGCLRSMRALRKVLRGNVYAVLGNHDTIRMVPDLESMGIRMLMNENVAVERGGARIHLAGVDDAHYFHADDVGAASVDIPRDGYSILLSHTPEIYRRAARADFDLVLAGHTHGGQICLPGGVPIMVEADMPRRLARGSWRFEAMDGYTSVGAGTSLVPVRFNCQPEVTLHRLETLG
jgi:predicted MPP superfamily phosphohydrolase